MVINRYLIISLAVAGIAAAYVTVRHPRHLEKRQLKEALRAWEDGGRTLAPPEVPVAAPP
jgi:hypothetical protein